MKHYEKGESVSVIGSNGKIITWIATGDEQRDSAIEIQINQAVEFLDWSYNPDGGIDIHNKRVDCSGLTHYLYSLVDMEIGQFSTNQFNNANGESVYSVADNHFDYNQFQTGDILTFNGHVAYYLGDGYFIHALNEDQNVVVGSFTSTDSDGTTYINGNTYTTDTGMIVTGAGKHWLKELQYVTRFGDNIYVEKDGNVIRAEKVDGILYIPTDVIYGNDEKEVYYKDADGNSYIKINNEFIPMSFESVDVGAGLIGTGNKIDFDTNFTAYINSVRNKTKSAEAVICDPLILDLDSNGFNIETKANGVNFDLDSNGFAEKINWTSKDGFLCLDLNGNGTIDNGGEMFGDNTLLADGTIAA